MKIAVLGGGGAMGGIFGGYLARAGEDVVLVDVSQAAVDAINRTASSIEEKDGSTATIGQGVVEAERGRAGRSHRQFRQVLQHRGGDPAASRCSASIRRS